MEVGTISMTIFLLLTCILGWITYFIVRKYDENQKYRDIEKIPGPPTVWFFGNVFYFGSTPAETFQNQLKLVREYGSFIRIWLCSKLVIAISDPIKLEYLLTSNEHINKSALYDGFKPWLGNGLLVSAGDDWRNHRKLITPTFHFKILEEFTDYIHTNSQILIKRLKEHVGCKSVDIYRFINIYNLDLISETAMKTNVNAQLSENTEYVDAVEGYKATVITRRFSFYKQIECLFRLTTEYRTQKKYIKTLKQFTDKVIRKRQEERRLTVKQDERATDSFGIKKKVAFLDLLLDLQGSGHYRFTDEEIREQVDTFMSAGHDTVSSATSFCLYELSKRPEIQKRLVEESNQVLGDDKDVAITMRSMQELKYLELVVKESLRFNAVAPFIEREIQSDVTMDGIVIPKGTTLQILIYAMHRSEKYFPDADKFDPERFLPENSQGRHPFAYIPFSAGPRNCIGQKYAMLSTKSTVIKILRNYELLPAEPEFEPILGNGAVLRSVNGIRIKLKSRA